MITIRANKQILVLCVWITFLAWAVWQHALQSRQPPIHDAFGYYLKAYNFWSAIDEHRLLNPLNIEPTFRPPGTILMSYPLGFETDYRGFYFRSVFFPILMISIAVMISGYHSDLDTKTKWQLVLISAFLTSLPCFYFFEISSSLPSPTYWGLVDNFLAGNAALAAAATVRSIRTQSLTWLSCAVLFSSLCVLIKPAGVLIMFLTGLSWTGLAALKALSVRHLPRKRHDTTLWGLQGVGILLFLYALVFLCVFTSNYLSRDNLAFGLNAITVMQGELPPISWSLLLTIVHTSLGYIYVVWYCLMILVVCYYLYTKPMYSLAWSKILLTGLVLASCLEILFGAWFWIAGSGGTTQIRFVVPFALAGTVIALPPILTAVGSIRDWARAIVSIFLIAPVLNMAAMLPQSNPSTLWQKWSGVNLTSGIIDPVMAQAQDFVNTVRIKRTNVVLYSMSLNAADSYFQSELDFAKIARQPMPTVTVLRPVDWQRSATFRIQEMLSADYWLFTPNHDSTLGSSILTTSSIYSLDQEERLFGTWASFLTTDEGVTIVSETADARVLRVTDTARLKSALAGLIVKHQWRKEFIAGNPQTEFTEGSIQKELERYPPAIEDTHFGHEFYLRALAVNRSGDEVTVRFWWKPLVDQLEHDWILFIHSIDSAGNIVVNNSAILHFNRSLLPPDGVYLSESITFRSPVKNGTKRIAVGFARPNQELPIADKGVRDWDNRRVIVELF